MSDCDVDSDIAKKQILVIKDGPYVVRGNIPLVHKTQVVSELGEPLTWKKDQRIDTKDETSDGKYCLCRCGKSKTMPFCDGIHREIGFDGTETAKTDGPSGAQLAVYYGTHLVLTKDPSLCMSSGFCGLCDTKLPDLVAASNETKARSLAIAMIERCPSGAMTYKLETGQADIEPDLPEQIADTTEITSYGPIPGPLWVTGEIEIIRADGQPFEPRNRVTLCNCGLSSNKPLCDGTHRAEAERLLKLAHKGQEK